MDAGGTATTERPPYRGSEWKHESPDFSRGENQVANLLRMRVARLLVKIRLGGVFSARQVVRMLVDLLGITYRLRVIRWYQRNLHNGSAPPGVLVDLYC
jgi:hypothetical protein